VSDSLYYEVKKLYLENFHKGSGLQLQPATALSPAPCAGGLPAARTGPVPAAAGGGGWLLKTARTNTAARRLVGT